VPSIGYDTLVLGLDGTVRSSAFEARRFLSHGQHLDRYHGRLLSVGGGIAKPFVGIGAQTGCWMFETGAEAGPACVTFPRTCRVGFLLGCLMLVAGVPVDCSLSSGGGAGQLRCGMAMLCGCSFLGILGNPCVWGDHSGLDIRSARRVDVKDSLLQGEANE
jgi:hypothetical protein